MFKSGSHRGGNIILFSSYANFGLLAAVSCTKVHNVTGNKYKFAQFVQETATNDHKCGQLLNKILTCYSRWCFSAIYALLAIVVSEFLV